MVCQCSGLHNQLKYKLTQNKKVTDERKANEDVEDPEDLGAIVLRRDITVPHREKSDDDEIDPQTWVKWIARR